MSGRVSASEQVLGMYEKYSANTHKEKKKADVQELLNKLYREGLIEERYTRDNVVYSAKSNKARMNIEPSIDAKGVVVSSGFVKEIEAKLQEICEWAGVALMLSVSTKQKRKEGVSITEATKELANLGFNIHEGERAWKKLCENETAEAVLETGVPFEEVMERLEGRKDITPRDSVR